MKIIYVPIDNYRKGLKRKFLYKWRNFFHFQNPGVFFEFGLSAVFKITTKDINKIIMNSDQINDKFDAIVVNSRLSFNKFNNIDDALIDVVRNIDIIKILFIRADKTIDIFNNNVLDKYDIVFKQEPFKDLNKYNISKENKNKIFPAMVNSTMHKFPKNKLASLIYNQKKLFKNEENNYKYDVFFLGRINKQSTIREDAWDRITKEGFNAFGGIQVRDGNCVDKRLAAKKISLKRYIKKMKESKINLALDGIGAFTPRHLDIWKLGCFMLASPSIRGIELPFKIEEGKHYVAFNDLDDMIVKINYYLLHNKEREKIARAGKELFEKEYDVKRHGEYIKNIIVKKIDEKNFDNNK